MDAAFEWRLKKMKRVIAVILVLCMALSLCACSSSGSGSASGEKVIKIGVFEPSSGDSASGGKKEILGMQYANSQEPTVTLGGETYKVELVYGDNGSSTDKAPSAASSLVSAGVSVVLGSYGSGVSMAGGPKFEEADVLANFAVSKFSAKTAYCLGESGNEYDQGLIAFFTKVFEAAGGKVITDSFPTGNSDFGSYLNKAKSEGADVIFTPVSIAYAVQIITQAASLGIEAPFLGSDTLDDNMVLEAIKGTDLQLYVSTFYQEGGAPEFDTGVKEYINASSEALAANGGNDTISAVTAMGYDAYFVALEAMKKADSGDKAAIMAALPSVTYTGVSGSIAFDAQGDAIRDTAYIKAADTASGAWVLETVQTGSGS